MAVAAIIPAAGYGKRMNSSQNKQFMLLRGKPVLLHTLQLFASNSKVDELIIVVREDELFFARELINSSGIPKVSAIVAGGKERQHSVWNGLSHVSSKVERVIVHDGARPLLNQEILTLAIAESKNYAGVVVGVPVKDTIKIVDGQQIIMATPQRERLWAVQTPQIFAKDILISAYKKAWQEGRVATDDAALVEAMGEKVKMVYGSYENIKITTPEDLILAEEILSRRENSSCG